MSGQEVVQKLDRLYPKIKTPLSHKDVFQLLIATVLSAQTTDVSVNLVTPTLFREYPDAKSLANARVSRLEKLIKPTGFFHVKARRIKEISQKLVRDFHGSVPASMEELLTLPGVGRKTANIVLSAGYDKIEGIAVDTHVLRLSQRIGLTKEKTPEKVELDLMKITPRNLWPRLTLTLILHGRKVCFAKKPECYRCVLNSKCAYFKTQPVKERKQLESSDANSRVTKSIPDL
jgi:endonuclease III